ncbi:MAG: hypothetical protein R3345_06095, partial [Fulvivirga sp.]|nr:hypothetical protein [Fulvivirga sp.]
DDFMIIKSKGKRSDFREIALDYTELIKEIDKHQPSKILMDHRDVIYDVHQSDALNLVRFYEKHEERFGDLTMACCMDKDFIHLGKYLAILAQIRGFKLKIFTDIEEAKDWLNKN